MSDWPGGVLESCSVYNATAQSVIGSTYTVMSFDSEQWDTNGLHDPSSNPSRITIKTPGLYLLDAHVTFASSTDTGRRLLMITLNGSSMSQGKGIEWHAEGGANVTDFGSSAIVRLAVGDYVEVQVYQDQATMNVYATLSATRLGG